MRKLVPAILIALCLIAVTPASAQAHHRGCRSNACDLRVDRIWGRAHPVMAPATASWFDDSGLTACQDGQGGTLHLPYGYAHLPQAGWSCGTRVKFCYLGRCVIGEREDSGPYVPGRLFDLTERLKRALHCEDLCHLHWRRL